MKTPGTHKEELHPTTNGTTSQIPLFIQQYLNHFVTPAMSDSLHSSTDTLVEPDTPVQPLNTIRREDLSTIPLSLQLALEEYNPPISTERPNTITSQLQHPNLSTYRSPRHP